MRLTTEQIEKIATAVADDRHDLFTNTRYIDRVNELISQAWASWDESLLKAYYAGEKPDFSTKKFAFDWVVSELSNVAEQHEEFINSFKG